ncbi:MAG: hypothetical protein E3K37_00105 [Candidatus Kuenenia sp.]|nr:hypothetical protein [Candidatus Kuenenia hertensis]
MKGIIDFSEAAKVFFLYSLRYSIPYLPLKLKHNLANSLAVLTSGGERAGVMKSELELLFGKRTFTDSEIKEIIVETLRNFRKDLFEIWSFPKLNSKKSEYLCTIDGMEHLRNALGKGKGVIIALCHFGSYKMILPCLGYKGYKITQVAANPLDLTGNDKSIVKNITMKIEYQCEKSLPAHFFYIGSTPRQIYRILQNNEILVMSLDGILDPNRISVPFLQRKVRLSPSLVKIAERTNAAILPVFTIREKNDKHKIIIDNEIVPEDGSDKEEREINVLFKFGSLMERYVKEHPSHYLWYLYKNKTEPPPIGSIIVD